MTEQAPPIEPQLPPYIIEGARSSRSRCKLCRRKIDKGALRIGYFIEGPYGTGYLWHHLKCSARRHFERVEEAYQQEAWNAAKEPPQKLPPLEQLRELQTQADDRKRARKQIPYAEIAPSARSKCKNCGEPIEKGAFRIALGRGVSFGTQERVAPVNVHPTCVAAEMNTPECVTESESFAEALRENSQDVASERIDTLLAEIGSLP